jgi:hypothetical protein
MLNTNDLQVQQPRYTEEQPHFSVCSVLYGDFPALAAKLLGSLAQSPCREVSDYRFGLNAVSQATHDLVLDFCSRQAVPCHLYCPPQNVGKYPLLRRMLYDEDRPVACWLMWFDDDSYLDEQCGDNWWQGVAQELRGSNALLLGVPHRIKQRGAQHLGIQAQPWYTGQPVNPGHRFLFAQGAWWVAESAFLRDWNYPFPEIFHNGGDSILGELVRQRQAHFHYSKLAVCHCEACLRPHHGAAPLAYEGKVHLNVGGRKGRRGIGVDGETYPWQNYVPGQAPCLDHHQFVCQVHSYR